MTKQTSLRQRPSTSIASHTPSAFAPRGFGDTVSLLPAVTPQAKLTVNTPGDKYEQEADSVADSVMRQGDADAGQYDGAEEKDKEQVQAKPLAGGISSLIQREAEDEDEEDRKAVQAKTLLDAPALLQRDPAPEEEDLSQTQASAPASDTAPGHSEAQTPKAQGQESDEEVQAQRKETGDAQSTDVSGVVQQGLSGGGQPLDAQTRSFMEPRFGHDFSQVRIHTDSRAAQSSEAIAARAYTVGSDIAFRSGEFSPGSSDGKRLLAHELTHVVQQSEGVQRDPISTNPPATNPPTATGASGGLTGGGAAGASIKPARALSTIVTDINNQYQTLFDKQQEAVTELASDFAKVDEPSTTDLLIQAGVGLAIGQASTALAGIIGTAAGNVASNFILNRALKSEAAGETVDMAGLVFDSDAARAKATGLAGSGGGWLADKAKENASKAYNSVAHSLPESQKFLETHRKSLIDMKAQAQSELLRQIAPGFEALPPNEGAVAAERFLAGVQAAHESGIQIQYLESVAQWGQLINGGAGADLTAARNGVLRMTYSASSPTADLTITHAEFVEMDADVLKRIHDTPSLANMKISDFPISKVFMSDGGIDSPPFIALKPGEAPDLRTNSPWLLKRAPKYGMDLSQTRSDVAMNVVVSLIVPEMSNLTLGQLGVISK